MAKFKWAGTEPRYLAGANREPGDVFEAWNEEETDALRTTEGVEEVQE